MEPPHTWEEITKVGIVIPLFKKGDKKDLNNYRGVCLLSMLSRILARVLATRLRVWAESLSLIDESQQGFRTGRSTADATQVVIRVNEETAKRRACYPDSRWPAAILLDIKKAYPRVSRPILWGLLAKYGIGKKTIRALKGLHEETVYMVEGGGACCRALC